MTSNLELISRAIMPIVITEAIIFIILVAFLMRYILKKQEQEPPTEKKAREIIEKEK